MIVSIFLAAEPEQALRSEPEVEVGASAGIVGDRNFGKCDYPGQNVTFIECESIARYNADYGQCIEPIATRRNILTRGVDLNSLVGREFAIGSAVFKGIELCTPCGSLGASLENKAISNAEVVKAFLTSGGLRADVVTGGRISTGMTIETLARGT